jgi:GET complex subunit GET2
MAQFSQQGQKPDMNTFDQTPAQPPKPPTLMKKLMPLLHLLSVWALLAYFVVWKEPQIFGGNAAGEEGWSWSWSASRRWAQLGRGVGRAGWGVEAVVCATLLFLTEILTNLRQPFFYAFLTLQILLHSLRIFSGIVCPTFSFLSLPTKPSFRTHPNHILSSLSPSHISHLPYLPLS